MEILPLIHNTSSVQRLLDFARLTLALGLDKLVVTRAYGAAAQHGLGELGRLVYKSGGSLIVLPDLKDAIDIIKPDRVLIVTRSGTPEPFDPCNPPSLEGRVLVAFNGGDPDFSPQEIALGTPIYPLGATGKLGAPGEAGLILYSLKRMQSAERSVEEVE